MDRGAGRERGTHRSYTPRPRDRERRLTQRRKRERRAPTTETRLSLRTSTMRNLSHSFTPREPSAAAIFRAGLPDHHHGRVLTAASEVDSWRRKNFAIRERLRLERRAGVRS